MSAMARFLLVLPVLAASCAAPVEAPRTCGPTSCPEGCCDPDGVCRSGTSTALCGGGGHACADCGAGTCQAAACVPPAGGGLDGGSCPPPAASPAGRSDFAAVVDPLGKRLVAFGGDTGVPQNCTPNPQFSAETWAFDFTCRTWRKLDLGSPPARARAVAALDTKRRRMVVFGGRYRAGTSGPYTVYDEVFALDLATDRWAQVATTGSGPPGLANAAAVYEPTLDRLLVFGGSSSTSGLAFTPHDRVWQLELANNNRWSELTPASAARPAARLFHAMALDAKRNRLILYGGGGANAFQGPFYGDVWAFDLGARTWSELRPSGSTPPHRIRPGLAEDPARDRLLLFGGHDDQAMGERNDLWALDLAANQWTQLRTGDTLKNNNVQVCDFPADFTEPDLASPERRDAHFFGNAGERLYLAAGRSDCGTLTDVWTLDPAGATWQSLRPSVTGTSCVRSGKQSCSSLCF